MISPMGRYHDGTVKEVLVHTIWYVNTHLHNQNIVHRPIGTWVRRSTEQQYWHRSLVHKARRRGWWPNSSLVLACGDRTFFLFTYHDWVSHTVSMCGIVFFWASSFSLLSCLVYTRYRSTTRAPSVIWGAVGGMYRMCVVGLVESVQFSYRSNENNLAHFHA